MATENSVTKTTGQASKTATRRYNDKCLADLARPYFVGIVGGTSYVSTIEYYKTTIERVNATLGGLTSAPILLYSLEFGQIKRYMDLDDWSAIANILFNVIDDLWLVGVKVVAIASNTLHRAIPLLEGAVNWKDLDDDSDGITLIHIGDVVAKKVTAAGIKRVGLLGTKETMQGDFIKKFLVERGIEVVVPDSNNQDKLNDLIFNEYCNGYFNTKTCSDLYDIIAQMCCQDYIEGVILGCTELGEALNVEWRNLLIGGHLDHDFEVDARESDPKLAESMQNFQIFDSAEIHIEAIANYCITGKLTTESCEQSALK